MYTLKEDHKECLIVAIFIVFVLIILLFVASLAKEQVILPVNRINEVTVAFKSPVDPLESTQGVDKGNSFNNWIPDTEYKISLLANAIYFAEGKDSNFPYGIKSVRCKNGENGGCRKVCTRTIKRNVERYKRYRNNFTTRNIRLEGKNVQFSYLEFLQRSYCPTSGNLTKSEKELNGNWLRLVKYFLDNPKKIDYTTTK